MKKMMPVQPYHSRVWFLFIALACIHSSSLVVNSSSISSISSHTNKGKNSDPNRAENECDRWVSASPIAIAALCEDGFAMVAAHTNHLDEPLLVRNQNMDDEKDLYSSLPDDYRGPFRIDRIDGEGSCLITAGWKTDCTSLASKCRSIAASELSRYGKNEILDISEGNIPVIAQRAALWLSQCCFSSNMRALSCIGLLTCIHSSNDEGNDKSSNCGSLWLIDNTGSYPVRALAIGNGSSAYNEKLCHIPFHTVSKEEGLKILIQLLIYQYKEDENKDIKSSLLEGSFLETAVIGFDTKTMKRVRRHTFF